MVDIQRRDAVLGDGWRTGASKPAGLYGELPPLPAHPPATTVQATRPLRKSATVD